MRPPIRDPIVGPDDLITSPWQRFFQELPIDETKNLSSGSIIYTDDDGNLAEDPNISWDSANKIFKVDDASVGNLPTSMAIGYHGI